MNTQQPDTQEEKILWQQARTLYVQGQTPRQIAHITAIRPSIIVSRAARERWPAPPPPDWEAIRKAWEAGQPDRVLVLQYSISASGLRKRRTRENWSRTSTRGIDALRRAVSTLEEALDQADMGDTVVTTRLAAALSMAAGRLRDAEKQQAEKQKSHRGNDDIYDFEGEDESLREHMTEMLMRLAETEEENQV